MDRLSWISNLFHSTSDLDERFVMHRYKSTRVAVLAGVLATFALYNYQWFAHHVIRWDYLAILAVMAAGKVGMMLHLRRTN